MNVEGEKMPPRPTFTEMSGRMGCFWPRVVEAIHMGCATQHKHGQQQVRQSTNKQARTCGWNQNNGMSSELSML